MSSDPNSNSTSASFASMFARRELQGNSGCVFFLTGPPTNYTWQSSSDAEENMIHVLVKQLHVPSPRMVSFGSTATLHDLKTNAEECGLVRSSQRWLYKGKALQDDALPLISLTESQTTPENPLVLHLVERPRPSNPDAEMLSSFSERHSAGCQDPLCRDHIAWLLDHLRE